MASRDTLRIIAFIPFVVLFAAWALIPYAFSLFIALSTAPFWLPIYIARRALRFVLSGRRRAHDAVRQEKPTTINWQPLRDKVQADAEADRRAGIDLVSPADPDLDPRSDGGASFAPAIDYGYFPYSPPSARSGSPELTLDIESTRTRLQRNQESFIMTPDEVDLLRQRRLALVSLNTSPVASMHTPASELAPSRNISVDFGTSDLLEYLEHNESPTSTRGTTTPIAIAPSSGSYSPTVDRRDSSQVFSKRHRKASSTVSLASVPEITEKPETAVQSATPRKTAHFEV